MNIHDTELEVLLAAIKTGAADRRPQVKAAFVDQLLLLMRTLRLPIPIGDLTCRCVAWTDNDGTPACRLGKDLTNCSTSCPSHRYLVSPPQEFPAPAAIAVAVCKYRGSVLVAGSCSCGDGNVYECKHTDGPGRAIGKMCNKERCKLFEGETVAE